MHWQIMYWGMVIDDIINDYKLECTAYTQKKKETEWDKPKFNSSYIFLVPTFYHLNKVLGSQILKSKKYGLNAGSLLVSSMTSDKLLNLLICKMRIIIIGQYEFL